MWGQNVCVMCGVLPHLSWAGGEGITHKISCCLIPVLAPMSLGCADSLLMKAKCANPFTVQ